VDHRFDRATHPAEGAAPTEDARSIARITVMIESRFVVETGPATGRHLKELTAVPVDFALYRRARAGNEPILDEDIVDVRNGDHFFARPPR
jgi:hypothetical protein